MDVNLLPPRARLAAQRVVISDGLPPGGVLPTDDVKRIIENDDYMFNFQAAADAILGSPPKTYFDGIDLPMTNYNRLYLQFLASETRGVDDPAFIRFLEGGVNPLAPISIFTNEVASVFLEETRRLLRFNNRIKDFNEKLALVRYLEAKARYMKIKVPVLNQVKAERLLPRDLEMQRLLRPYFTESKKPVSVEATSAGIGKLATAPGARGFTRPRPGIDEAPVRPSGMGERSNAAAVTASWLSPPRAKPIAGPAAPPGPPGSAAAMGGRRRKTSRLSLRSSRRTRSKRSRKSRGSAGAL